MQLDPKVQMAAVIGTTLIVVSLVAGLVVLSVKNSDASTILSLVSTIFGTVNLMFLAALRTKVNQLQEQSNGTTTKLIDAAIASPPLPERHSNAV